MLLRALALLGSAGFLAQATLVQSPTTTATVRATVDSLLASGYEVKAVTLMSSEAIKDVFSDQSLPSQIKLAAIDVEITVLGGISTISGSAYSRLGLIRHEPIENTAHGCGHIGIDVGQANTTKISGISGQRAGLSETT